MDLAKHECRSVISAQSTVNSKLMQNNNNENVNGNSGIHATSTASNCDYDDADNMDMNAGELSGNLTDSCGSEKMNASDGKIGGLVDDKDKVSGE